jgi:hypothetical protein
MGLTLAFRCGHRARIDPDKTPSPMCVECGERRVARVLKVDPPRITGHANGPLVNTRYLGAQAVSVAERPLTLKDPNG